MNLANSLSFNLGLDREFHNTNFSNSDFPTEVLSMVWHLPRLRKSRTLLVTTCHACICVGFRPLAIVSDVLWLIGINIAVGFHESNTSPNHELVGIYGQPQLIDEVPSDIAL